MTTPPPHTSVLVRCLVLLSLCVFALQGCKKGNKCTKAAEQHCSRYSDDELRDMYGGQNVDESRQECVNGYAANCNAEREYGGEIPPDVVIDPNQE